MNLVKFKTSDSKKDNGFLESLTNKLKGLQLNMLKAKSYNQIFDLEKYIETIFKDMKNNIPEFNKIEYNDKILSGWEGSYRHYY